MMGRRQRMAVSESDSFLALFLSLSLPDADGLGA